MTRKPWAWYCIHNNARQDTVVRNEENTRECKRQGGRVVELFADHSPEDDTAMLERGIEAIRFAFPILHVSPPELRGRMTLILENALARKLQT